MSATFMTRGLLAALLLFAPGCANLFVGRSFDAGAAKDIEPRRTKRADVAALLGPPMRSERLGGVKLDVHKMVTPDRVQLVIVSYRDDDVVHVTTSD